MNDTLTRQTLETLQYRKEQLARKAGQVERLLSGRETDLRPLLRDGDGRYSEEKTRALAEELVRSLDLYLRSREDPLAKKDRPLSQLPPALEEAEGRFYHSLLYCLLRLSEDPPPWDFIAKGTFGDLLELVRDLVEYDEKERFYLDTVYRKAYSSEVWLWLDRACEAFTGEKPEDTVSQEDLEAVERRYPEEIAEAVKLSALEEELKKDPEFLERFSEPLEEWEVEELKQEEEARQNWLDGFAEKEAFCREYLSWRGAYFDLRAWDWLDRHMEAMLDVYLYQEGSSTFLTDETYFSAYALLNQAVRQLQELLERRE